jgi:large subunit ribosomal protein L14
MTPKIKGTHRRYPKAGVGDMVIISVKKGVSDMRRQLLKAVIVRQRRPFRRPDGTMVQFEDNAAVIVTDTGETKGSMIKGPVALEAAERWPRIAATASIII